MVVTGLRRPAPSWAPEPHPPKLRYCVRSGSPTSSKTSPLTIFDPLVFILNLVIGFTSCVVQKPLWLLSSATASPITTIKAAGIGVAKPGNLLEVHK